MARRQLLTDEKRQALLGIPPDADSLARLFTLYRVDRNLVAERRGDANRLGCAVQLVLLRYPAAAFAEYARQLAAALRLRPPTMADLPPMIEAAADAARAAPTTASLSSRRSLPLCGRLASSCPAQS